MRQLHTSISEAIQPQRLCTYIAIYVQNFCMTMNMYGIDPCLAMPWLVGGTVRGGDKIAPYWSLKQLSFNAYVHI